MFEKLAIPLVILVTALSVCGYFYTHRPSSAEPPHALDVAAAAKIIRDAAVHRAFPEAAALPSAIAGAVQGLFLTVSDGVYPPVIAYVYAEDGFNALRQALEQIYSGWPPRGAARWVKLDLISGTRSLSVVAPRGEARGIYGFAFDPARSLALLPDEIMAGSLTDTEGRFKWDAVARTLARRYPGAPLPDLAASGEDAVTVLDLASAFADEEGAYPVYRGHRVFGEEISRDALAAALIPAGHYLAASCGEDGRFTYAYLPKSNRLGKEPYHNLRHAGTLYSLMRLYEFRREPSLREAIDRALGYLVSQVGPCAPGEPASACLMDDGASSLAAQGLALVTLAQFTATGRSRTHLPLMQRLGQSVLARSGMSAQQAAGALPGVAILGLVRLYQVSGDVMWLDNARRALQEIVAVRDRAKAPDALVQDHWLMIALSEIHRVHGEAQLTDYAQKLTLAILAAQQRVTPLADWQGGFGMPPSTLDTAVRAEALAAAWRLAQDRGDAKWAAEINLALRGAVRFVMAAQHRPERVMYLARPDRALGGFGQSLTNYKVRMDYVQHGVAALLDYDRILVESRNAVQAGREGGGEERKL